MKLTLINVMWRGRRYSAFVMLPVWEDGKVRLNSSEIMRMCNLDIPRGDCVGYCC